MLVGAPLASHEEHWHDLGVHTPPEVRSTFFTVSLVPVGAPLPSHEEQQQEYVRFHNLRSEVHQAKQSNRRLVFGAGILASLAFLIGIGVGVFVREHHGASALGAAGGGRRKNSLRARA